MLRKIRNQLSELVDSIAPSPETLKRREMAAVQQACCQLLMEVARLDEANAQQKREAVAQAMQEQFGMPQAELAALIDTTCRPENRLTGYYDQVRQINECFDPIRKARFIEQLWRVAAVDGDIDMYEDSLVRTLSDLMYVSHSDFILAKNRVRAQLIPQLN